MKRLNLVVQLIVLAVLVYNGACAEETADLVILNGNIITVDEGNTMAQAVAVKDSLILKTGTNQEIMACIGDSTDVRNMNGATITPGIIDAHSHLMFYGISTNEYVNLREGDTQSIEDVVAKIEERVQVTAPGEWIVGDGFFKLERMVTKYDLDPVSPENPVFLQSLGGHYGSCNSIALEIAGVDSSFPDPVGGIIERDTLTGEPNGVLWNHPAMDAVRRYCPPMTEEAMTRDVIWAQQDYMTAGVTSFQDVNVRGVSRIRAYTDARDSLKIRGYLSFTIETTREARLSYDSLEVTQDPWLSLMGDKFLVDGQPPTAFTHEPHNGVSWDFPTWDPDTLKQAVKDLHRAGHQLCFHVIGDAAIDLALEAIEEALDETPREDHRHRLEHVFIPTEAAIQKMKELNVIVSLEPSALYTGGDFYAQLFGPERIQRLMPVRSFLDAGVPVALGTDYPTVMLLHPKYTLWSSIVRRTLSGAVIAPDERITIQEALRLHTMGSAYAAFEEDVKGSIEEGKYADMTIWSDDLYSVPVQELRDLVVLGVVVAGTVYENPNVNGVDRPVETGPETFTFLASYPNPFNGSTRIVYYLNRQGHTVLNVYNSIGQLVRTLVDQQQMPGEYIIPWDGFDRAGNRAPSGPYYFRLRQGETHLAKKAVLIK